MTQGSGSHHQYSTNEAAHDLALGQALVGAPFDLGPGRWVAAHADQGDAPQGVVGLAVAATIPPVAVGAARGGRDRRDAAQMGKAASPRSRWGLSPAVTTTARRCRSRPRQATRVDAAEVTSAWSWRPSRPSSAWSCHQRRARVPRLALVAAIGLVRGPGRSPAHLPTSAVVLSPSSGWRSSSGRWRARRTAVRRPPPWP
jgi:hypothetical protein